MQISGFRDSGFGNHRPGGLESRGVAAQERDALAVSRQRSSSQTTQSSGKLELTTAEGDKVTLSFSRSSEASQADAYARVGNDSARVRSSARTESLDVSVEFEGDLSKEELNDIRKLVKNLAGATRDLAQGDTEGAARKVDRANQLDTIAQFSYQYQFQQEASFEKSRLSVFA